MVEEKTRRGHSRGFKRKPWYQSGGGGGGGGVYQGWAESFDNEREQKDGWRSAAWVRGKVEVSQVITSASQLQTPSYHRQGALPSIQHNPLLCSLTRPYWRLWNQGRSRVYTAFSPNYIIRNPGPPPGCITLSMRINDPAGRGEAE